MIAAATVPSSGHEIRAGARDGAAEASRTHDASSSQHFEQPLKWSSAAARASGESVESMNAAMSVADKC